MFLDPAYISNLGGAMIVLPVTGHGAQEQSVGLRYAASGDELVYPDGFVGVLGEIPLHVRQVIAQSHQVLCIEIDEGAGTRTSYFATLAAA